MDSYWGLTCVELRKELARRGARTSGRKIELIERLQAYDRNNNFQDQVVNIIDINTVPEWPKCGFKQLTNDNLVHVPPVTEHHINGYLTLKMTMDMQASGNTQAMEKGKLLLDSNRLDACSFVESADGSVFLSGICGASMKGVGYSLKVKLSSRGEVTNGHCECPAGKGPFATCKHIAALLFCIADIRKSGSIGTLNSSCTDKLQTFHRPSKKFAGSPVKAQKLFRGRELELADPRPVHLVQREGRFENMRSILVNFCSNNNIDIAARYLTEGTNLQAASIDHHYLKRPLTEQVVFNAVKVTKDEAASIESKTKKQSTCQLWFDEREWRLTASRFGEICSLTARRNKEKLCKSLVTCSPICTAATSHGLTYEKIAIEKFEKLFKMKVRPSGLVIDTNCNFLAASPDGVTSDSVVEVKCPYSGRELMIEPGKEFRFLQKTDGCMSLKRSHKYFAQVQGQLHITKKSLCHFVVFTFKDFKVIEVPYDREYCELSLIPKLKAFYKVIHVPYIASTL